MTEQVIGGAIEVHKTLGPGFTERIYAKALQHELRQRDVAFTAEHAVRVQYKGQLLGVHRIDMVVDALVVELKAVYEINNFHVAQMLSYLKATGKQLGLILNFSRAKLEVKRVAL